MDVHVLRADGLPPQEGTVYNAEAVFVQNVLVQSLPNHCVALISTLRLFVGAVLGFICFKVLVPD